MERFVSADGCPFFPAGWRAAPSALLERMANSYLEQSNQENYKI
jgi:hypothetical protein